MEDKINDWDILASLDLNTENELKETNYEEVVASYNENKTFEDVFWVSDFAISWEQQEQILQNTFSWEWENEGKIWEKNFFEKLKSLFHFTTGYAFTSAIIFVVLLLFSNYNAYYNIVKSYVFQWQFRKNEELLINSVEASSLVSKEQENTKGTLELNSANQHSIKRLIAESNKEDLELNIDITPYENRIVIPKISKNIPLVDIKNQTIEGQNELNNIFMKELENGVVRYPWSSKPWKDGTTFIFWHSSNFPWIKGDYNDVFALLDNVVKDDIIVIYYNQEKYTYKVKEKKVVKPWDVSVLKREAGANELSIMTCWPVGTTFNRLIVVSELVKE